MVDSQIHTIVLKKAEEKRLEELFNHFSKTENNVLKFNEFMMFALDRCMLSNRYGLTCFHKNYSKALEVEFKPPPSASLGPQQGSAHKGSLPQPIKQEIKYDKNSLTRNKFNYLITLLADAIYGNDKNRIEKMFNEMLSEKAVINKDSLENPRIMMFDELNKKLLSQNCVKILEEYEEELKRCFTLYYSENILYGKMLLEWSELSLQNKRMTSFGLIRFLKDADVIPNVLSIEILEEILMKMLPAVSVKEHHFYSNAKLIHIYEKDLSKNEDPRYDGDPQLFFHEFEMVLCRIAIETYPKELQTEKRDIEKPLYRFFNEVLCIRPNNEISLRPLPSMNRRFFAVLEASYIQIPKDDKEIMKRITMKQHASDDENIDPKKLLLEYANKNRFDVGLAQIDYQETYKNLIIDLPPFPDPIKIVPENPPPYNLQPKVIGDQLPKPPPEKNKPRPKPEKKVQRKKGEPEPKPIIWEEPPGLEPKGNHEHIVDFTNQLEFGEVNISDVKRATLSDIEVAPCLIKEILYPTEIPQASRVYVEAAITAHNSQNYAFAVENYETAKKKWLQETKKYELPEQVQLYFEFSIGQIYESAGRDDFALQKYLICKGLGEKIEWNNPDQALAFCGIGSVLYHMEEYKLAGRCFLKARGIRETMLGSDTVDTAATYNNIGCCMFFLKRIKESYSYFKLAQAIMEAELGMFHFRTQTVLNLFYIILAKKQKQISRNLQKCQKQYMELVPAYKNMWIMYEKDPYKKVTKKKGAQKKK